MNPSIRWRLLVGIATTTLIVFSMTAATLFLAIRAMSWNEFDESLAAKARAMATLVKQDGQEFVIPFDPHPMQEFARKIRPEYYQIWDEDGTVLARSRRLAQRNLMQIQGSFAAPRFRSAVLPDERPGRMVGVQFLPTVKGETLEIEDTAENDDAEDRLDRIDFSKRRRVTLVLAKETEPIDQMLGRLCWMLVAITSTALVISVAILSWIVKRGFIPFHDLSVQIADLDERDLGTRIHLGQVPLEMIPVVSRLNELLARLDESFQRERTFTADIAHELRTPLGGLRAMMEVTLGRHRGGDEYRQVLRDCEEVCVGAQRLVETLLSLVRMDAGGAVLDRSFVEIHDLIERTWSTFQTRAANRDLTVTIDGPRGVLLDTDSEMIRVVLANLCDNAVDYTDLGGYISFTWYLETRGLVMKVATTGCDLNHEQAQRVFDRLWRADSARGDTGFHAGLGLPLCQKVVHALGGTILATVVDGKFIVTIEFGPQFIEHSMAFDVFEDFEVKDTTNLKPATIS